jgi:hypothetical protein
MSGETNRLIDAGTYGVQVGKCKFARVTLA